MPGQATLTQEYGCRRKRIKEANGEGQVGIEVENALEISCPNDNPEKEDAHNNTSGASLKMFH